MVSQRCIDLVKRFEGFSPTIYVCPAGYPTIGYGHVVTPEEKDLFKVLLTEAEAESLLLKDLLKFYIGVKKLLPGVYLHQYCWDALTSFAFNVGLYAFRASTLRRKILGGYVVDAADQFERWIYAGGRPLPGLKKRRQAEKSLYIDGLKEMRLI